MDTASPPLSWLLFWLPSWPPSFAFERPEFLWLFAGLPLLWLVQWSRAGFISLVLHSVLVGVLILCAAGWSGLRPAAAGARLLLAFDVSHSLTPDQRRWMRETAVRQFAPTPDTPTLLFAGRGQWLPWSQAEPLLLAPPPRLQLEETNLAGALTSLLGESPEQVNGSSDREEGDTFTPRGRHTASSVTIYLLSDGWETVGSAAPLLPLLAERRHRLYPFAPPGAESAPNIAIQRIGAPRIAQKGDTVALSLVLDNSNPRPVRGELALRHHGRPVWQGQVSLSPGVSLLTRRVSLSEDGLVPLQATFTPAAGVPDAHPDDNRAVAWVQVGTADTVLLLSARERDNRYLRQVLGTRGFTVEAVDVSAPSTVAPAPESFGAVVLNNVDKNSLPSALLTRLPTYVRNGGGLIMVGGEASLGLGGYTGTPVEHALPVSLTPPQKEQKRTALMLVIDTSGSMRREQRLLFAKAGVRGVARNLKESDLLGVIGFDTEPFAVIPLNELGQIHPDLESRNDRLTAAGGTSLLPALEEAKRHLERQDATRKHIVILTDGETGGSGSDYLDLVAVMRQELNMTISTIAVGRRPNLRLLSRLAAYGGGAFHHTTDPASLPELFIGELEEKAEEKTMIEADLTPVPNPHSPLLTDSAKRRLPQVKGYVEARLKPGARGDVSLRVNGTSPPLLASWSYGQGRAVAFTSDANGRWSAPWIGWDGFGAFWEQVVRWSLHSTDSGAKKTDFTVELGHTDQGLVIDLFSHADQERGRAAFAELWLPSGRTRGLSLERLAPGHYQGVYPDPQPGDYRIEVRLPSGETLGPLGYTVPALGRGEVPRPQPNLVLLETLAQATGGSLNPDPSDVVHRGRNMSSDRTEGDTFRPSVSPLRPQPFLPYLIPLAIGLYVLELLARRMAEEPSGR